MSLCRNGFRIARQLFGAMDVEQVARRLRGAMKESRIAIALLHCTTSCFRVVLITAKCCQTCAHMGFVSDMMGCRTSAQM
jgi:hypothetical protein